MSGFSVIQWISYSVASLLLAVISWKVLRKPRSHGFYRFFAWEAILGLVVLNAPVWFSDPFSWNQLISWILLVASVIPLVLGVYSLRSIGRPDPTQRSDPELLGIEKTTNLVTSGI
jgi:membrane protein implicated in regulation of membrane protease activity